MFGWFRKLIQQLRCKARGYHEQDKAGKCKICGKQVFKKVIIIDEAFKFPSKPRKAVHQDLGKFFKGGRRGGFAAKEYRKTILQKKKIEDEER